MDTIRTFVSNNPKLVGFLLLCFAPIWIGALYFGIVYLHKIIKLPLFLVWFVLYIFILVPWAWVVRRTLYYRVQHKKGNSIFTYWYDNNIYDKYDDLQPFKELLYARTILPAMIGLTKKHRFRRSLMEEFEWRGKHISLNKQTKPWYYEAEKYNFDANLIYAEQFINKSKTELALDLVSTNIVYRKIAELSLKINPRE